MDYVQLTFDDWLAIKEKLRKELQGVSEGFIRIGYQLKQIREQRLYEKDGYKDLASFAKQEYGLSASVVSRFMAINTKFSVDGNSEYLRPEFAGLGSSKLGEMLTIRDEDMELIGPGTARESIRALKRFEKEEQEAEHPEASDRETILFTIVEEFFRNQQELLNDICSDGTTAPIEELVNPSGNRTFRTGIYFVSFFDGDKGIKVKAFGQNRPETFTWDEFEYAIDEIFEFCGADTWARHYEPGSLDRKEKEDAGDHEEAGTEEGDSGICKGSIASDVGDCSGDDETDQESPGPDQEGVRPDTEDTGEDRESVQPADRVPEQEDGEPVPDIPSSPGPVPDGNLQDVHDRTDDEPEEISPEDTEVVPNEIAPAQKNRINTGVDRQLEPSGTTRVSRKDYMEKMSSRQMAKYLSSHLSTAVLKDTGLLFGWLEDLVEV